MMGRADNSIRASRKPFSLALLVSCVAVISVSAAAYPTGVRNSAGPRGLNQRQLQQIQESLRYESGLMELGFDSEGGLTLGDRGHVQGGSATARTLLIAAVDGEDLYELESHEGSSDIAF